MRDNISLSATAPAIRRAPENRAEYSLPAGLTTQPVRFLLFAILLALFFIVLLSCSAYGDWYGTEYPDEIYPGGESGIISGSPNGGNTGTDDNRNTIDNSGTATYIYGSDNSGDYSSGGSNTIYNSGTVTNRIYGSYNEGDNSSGGSNTIYNSGTVGGNIYGSRFSGTNSSSYSNTIYNSGTVGGFIFGYYSYVANTSGGKNTIYNYGTVEESIYGSESDGINGIGGSNTIYNYGTVMDDIYASYNHGINSIGGSNIIYNYGTVEDYIRGSFNSGDNCSGGSNIIYNYGTVRYIEGTRNRGANSSGGSNFIYNSGTVTRDIYGNHNYYGSGGSNTIYNSGTVMRDIYGSYNEYTNSSGGSNTIYNSGTVMGDISGSYNGSYNHGANTGGSNTIINSGIVTGNIYGSWNVGANTTSTGNIIINYGTVSGDIYGSRNDGGNSSGGDDTITNSGTVAGNIYGMDGNDTIIFTGGSVLGGYADGGDGTDTLGFNNIGTVDGNLLGPSSTYRNFENLAIYGGSNILTGSGYLPGSTTVYQGILIVDGTLTSSSLDIMESGFISIPGVVTNTTTGLDGEMSLDGTLNTGLLIISSSGFLGGNGSINGDMVVSGTVSPGHSIGTLTVNGSLDFMPGSTYIVELAATGKSDLLQVNGPVTIHGGTLSTSLETGLYADGESWRIISADSVSGLFSSIRTNFTSYTIDLEQVRRGGALDLVIVRTPYASFGETDNQSAVGGALDTLLPSASGNMANLLLNMDFGMTPSQITATLKGLNPEIYASYGASGLNIANNFGRMVAIRQLEPEATDTGHLWNIWGQLFGNWLDRDEQDDVPGYTLDTTGSVVGIDRHFGTRTRAGVLLGYSDSDLSWDEPGNSGSISGKYIGLYSTSCFNGFHLDASLGVTALDNSGYRSIETPAFISATSADFSGIVWGGGLSGGYDFQFGSMRVGPVVAIGYQYLDQDHFTESGGGDFGVRVQDSTIESLTASIGLRASAELVYSDWQLVPKAMLGVVHQFKDDPFSISASFVDYSGASFAVTGDDPIKNEGVASLGLTASYNENLILVMDFAAAYADNRTSAMISAGLSWKF